MKNPQLLRFAEASTKRRIKPHLCGQKEFLRNNIKNKSDLKTKTRVHRIINIIEKQELSMNVMLNL